MSLGRRLISTGGAAVCTTDSADVFGDSSGVALYNLDYDASDASGSYDGTPSNVTFGVGGKINYGARFNGSSSYIDVSSFSFGSDNLSISMWIKPSSTQNAYANIIDFNQTNTSKVGVFAIQQDASNTNQYKIWQWNGSSYNQSNSVTLTADTWNHLVYALQSNGNYAFYLNGTSSTSGSNLTASTSGVTETLNIGRWYNNGGSAGRYFNGDIDQVRIFSKALNQTEVDTLYNNGDGETACVYTATTTDNDYPTTNLAYYKLDNSAEDEKGSYDGTETNIEYRFGRYGQAAVFNGSSSKIDTNISTITSNAGSVSLWVKTTTGTQSAFFGGQSPSTNRFYFGVRNSNFWMGAGDTQNSYNISASSLLDGNWHHVVLTLDGSTAKYYLDGNSTPVDTISYTSGGTIGVTPLIGALDLTGSFSSYTNGSIDQVRIYSTALSASQVAELYNEKPEVDTSNFKTVLYEGTGSTQYISNVGFQPDLVWIKNRDDSGSSHRLYNSINYGGPVADGGTTYYLIAERDVSQRSSTNTLTSLNSNGFFLYGTGNNTNANGDDYVAWCWKGGGDDVLNEEGTIDSQVSANTDAGFSIVKYTGSGAAGMNFGHGLTEAIPELVIIKNLSIDRDWQVFGGSIFERMQLNNTGSDDQNLGLTITSTTIQTTQTFRF